MSKTINKKNIIYLTKNAVIKIKYLIEKKDNSNIVGVKFGIKNRGCNGKSYTMDYLEKDGVFKNDECIDFNDFKVNIDSKAIMFIIGTTIDYVDTPISSEFVFTNPNSKGACGCGESFNI